MYKPKLFSLLLLAFLFVSIQGQEIDRSKAPEPAKAPPINLGAEPQRFELENGLKVFVVEDHQLPKVAMSLTLQMIHIQNQVTLLDFLK